MPWDPVSFPKSPPWREGPVESRLAPRLLPFRDLLRGLAHGLLRRRSLLRDLARGLLRGLAHGLLHRGVLLRHLARGLLHRLRGGLLRSLRLAGALALKRGGFLLGSGAGRGELLLRRAQIGRAHV